MSYIRASTKDYIMKMNFTPLAMVMLMLLSVATYGQTRKVVGQELEKVNPNNGLIRCVSSEYEKSLQAADANCASRAQFEQWIAPKVAEVKQRMATGRNVAQIITIPVVVHVIHNGDALGVNENISTARVLSQIAVLNQDFRRMMD